MRSPNRSMPTTVPPIVWIFNQAMIKRSVSGYGPARQIPV